ncbi:MAG: AMP-binding protein [Methylococcales bacterium]
MSPMAFLEKPVRWLEAVSKYRAATSGGPNFAYDLCVRKVTAEHKRDLDLSAWTLAFNGSEAVRAETLERFARAFAECGFRRESSFPCYGLAEATLFVTGGRQERHTGCAPRTAQPAVDCGRPGANHAVLIVDPKTRIPCPEGQAGEIWVAGPSVARGYWNRPEESRNTFRATPVGCSSRTLTDLPGTLCIPYKLKSEASFLRTGDLGLLDNGRLYVTGRIKDLIMIRGRNFYPQDIEHVLTDRVEALRPGGCAAFSVAIGDEESLVVVGGAWPRPDPPGRLRGDFCVFAKKPCRDL